MMLDAIATGQVRAVVLLIWAVLIFLYFLPAIAALQRGHRRFLVLLALNVLVSPLQAVLLALVAPGLTRPAAAGDPAALALTAALVNFGPGWLALLAWAFKGGEPDPRVLRMRETKLYDALMALPLILWFGYGGLQLRPTLVGDIGLIAAGRGSALVWAQLFSLSMAVVFDLLTIWLLVVRDRPVRKARGVLPRLFGFLGTFLGVGILQFPVVPLSPALQFTAAILVGLGSLGSALVLWRLGKAFSIMPEARRLVTGGPYAYARHPLYAVEMITVIGTALQFAQPGAGLVALGVVVLLVIRSLYEERVLAEAYPEYELYRLKTKRFVPGVI